MELWEHTQKCNMKITDKNNWISKQFLCQGTKLGNKDNFHFEHLFFMWITLWFLKHVGKTQYILAKGSNHTPFKQNSTIVFLVGKAKEKNNVVVVKN